jgi:hypothetical protein
MVTAVAPVATTVKVDDVPATIVVGLATMVTVAPVTDTFAVAVADPPLPEAVAV